MTLITSPCAICGRDVVAGDVMVRTDRGWSHVTCTKDGILRWKREGRPYDDPLEWDRYVLPNWYVDAGNDREWAQVGSIDGEWPDRVSPASRRERVREVP